MFFRRLALLIILGALLLIGRPTSASAEGWDYLFDDLSWSQADDTSEGGGEWSISIGGFSDAGRDWGIESSGFWDYLFRDLSWPDGTFSVAGRLGGG
ncbi:MAG TPA: hypothetical protein DEB30_03975 [Candidatus Peribacter riflensis]|uniref:Uncharacterized protein n=1 Tax=Candidatus Peribacter riflensis TaxID=1735162 RepID=A0A0S1SV52_9BACT|nr:MAG: hypothetical protein PeribacterA2_0407 [Candidatus Peribacter riflensis]OGJ76744.1 MAG: hypothetical protein A2398_01105 [Candidatus Peribacteria bacterium RIFOXYB1_FULL_57_12]OGJ82344.1 MAG: hypothetical protein A2412_04045 [Candidatus Peribacteria bacterium RIFOXYC1_FULL_58_8]ALM11996.1 MAG: hypothetical protein PeribacterC2_0406 [Candidatus Peribacter riflensis]ALM13099.1 MAG: hypothetical protein PeribacterD1_0407 [Candidatus Peribacter riflensis]